MATDSGAFDLGRQSKVVVKWNGITVDLGIVEGFSPKQDTVTVTVKGIDGKRRQKFVPDGWSGSISATRSGSDLDQIITAIETMWANAINIPDAQIYQYVSELDGSRTVFRFNAVQFHLGDAGTWKSDDAVKQSIGWSAQRRVIV